MATFVRACNSSISIISKFLKPRIDISYVPNRGRYSMNKPPTKKYPPWLPKQYRALQKEDVTRENTKFIDEVIASKYAPRNLGIDSTVCNSPLKSPPIEPQTWCPDSRRTGVIAKKIGIYPLWLKNGKKVLSTLLQVIDNHVIKYIPPEEHNPMIGGRHRRPRRRLGCLVVGADSTDPQRFTKEYCGMFTDAGVMPKKLLTRFNITPDGALQPGTPLYAAHFKPGEVVDIRAKTMDRGFQGVMKRWGFHGMPATHGVTKTHRRPGNIGSGGTKARVMPGTKLPGHMGNRYRVFRGLKVLRVNTKYNVLWVLGQALPGETNSLLQIYDTLLPLRKLKEPPHFPTYMPTDEQSLEEELYDDDVQPFGADSLKFEPEA